MKVLLMGNGCSATDHKLGKIIDSEFDYIFRMNRFKTKGFEEYVGTKTDGWVITDNLVKWVIDEEEGVEGSNNWKEYKDVYISIPSFKYEHEYVRISNEIRVNGLPHNVQVLPKIIGDVATEKCNLSEGYWPTLGMAFLYSLILHKDIDEVYIHGFDGKSKKYKYLHYYDVGNVDWETNSYYDRMEKKAEETPWSKVHDDDTEYQHILTLIEDGTIKKLSEV